MMRFALDKELTVQIKCGFVLVFVFVFVCILCYIHLFFFLNHLNYYLGCGLHLQIRSCRIQSTFSCVFFFPFPFVYAVAGGKLLKFVRLIPETVWIYFDPFISAVMLQWRAIEIQSILNNINSEKCIYKTTKIVISVSKSYIMDLFWRPSEPSHTIFSYLFLFSIRSIFSEKISCRLQCVAVFIMQ